MKMPSSLPSVKTTSESGRGWTCVDRADEKKAIQESHQRTKRSTSPSRYIPFCGCLPYIVRDVSSCRKVLDGLVSFAQAHRTAGAGTSHSTYLPNTAHERTMSSSHFDATHPM